MFGTRISRWAALAACFCATSVTAGIADPVQLINGTDRAKLVITAVGVRADSKAGVTVDCLSLEKAKPVLLAVEVFSGTGFSQNDITAGEGVITLAPGETRGIHVVDDGGSVAFTSASTVIRNVVDVTQGSLRVVATSSKIACSVITLDRVNSPPNFIWPNKVFVKTKQQGD